MNSSLTRFSRSFGVFSAALLATVWPFGIARADLAWKGTVSSGSHARFALTDTTTGASKWVSVGGSFESYAVSEYDEQRQVLVLFKDGARVELGLAVSQFTPPAPAPDDLRTLSGLALATELANRGDAELGERLAQHRGAILHHQEIVRLLDSGERAVRANSPDAPSPVAIKSMQADVLRSDQDIARMKIEIESLANAHRRQLFGGS